MAKLEDLSVGSVVNGLLSGEPITVVSTKWYGSDSIEVFYKTNQGTTGSQILYRDAEASLTVLEKSLPWSFDVPGEKLRLISEAYRINLAHLFDPYLAVHTSAIEPLPHQISAVYEEMMPNPQRAYGADVTSRLNASMEGQRTSLQRCITGAIRRLALGVLEDAHRPADDLQHAVLTGNTAMLYLLTGRDVRSIAFAPFEPETRFGCEVPGETVLFPHTRVWLPHCISAYVGADITCAMLYAATRPEASIRPLLLADIGTNGEMALLTHTRTLTCSTAAGPAFEGAGIRCGMTAQAGAICHADVQAGRLLFSVIGSGAATGICGSGLVDAIAALRTLGVLDETGRMNMTGHPLADCMEQPDGQPAFRFPGTDVLLTQADVRTMQLAKSALCAGILTLVAEAGLTPEDVKAFQIAGGFGSGIRPDTAAAIGLIPACFAGCTYALGNAAGAGAAMMLLSDAEKAKGTTIAASQVSIELSTSGIFASHFMGCMALDTCE